MDPRSDDSRGAAARQDDAVTAVSSVAYGFMGSQALFAALEIGLFTELAAGPASAAALAHRLGLDAGPILALLEACTGTELLERDGDRYRNSAAASRYLVRDARGYMGDYYLRQIAATLYAQVPAAARVIRGQAAGVTYAGFLDDPARTEEFIRGQHAGSSGPAHLLARDHDLSAFTRLLDLGGGSGAFSIEIARRHGLSAIVVDRPSVVAVARKIVEESGLADRIRCVPGDAVTGPWPDGADLILLSYVVSSYGPDVLRELLGSCSCVPPARWRAHHPRLRPPRGAPGAPQRRALVLREPGDLGRDPPTHGGSDHSGDGPGGLRRGDRPPPRSRHHIRVRGPSRGVR